MSKDNQSLAVMFLVHYHPPLQVKTTFHHVTPEHEETSTEFI